MAQRQTTGQRIKQAPKKMQISTMIEKTDLELEQMIREEVENNIALELITPYEAPASDGPEGSEAAAEGGDDAYDDTQRSDAASRDDGALSDEDRGDKVEIERDDDDVPNTSSQQSSADDDGRDIFGNTMSETTFREDLKQQVDMLPVTAEERYLAYYIIDCLEDDGYLRRPLDELVDDLEFTQHFQTTVEDLEAVLVEVIQQELEPTGIGARDLRECLLLQVLECKGPAARLAYLVLRDAFDELVAKHYDTIQERFGITSHRAWVDVMHTIRHLNPKPGNMEPVTSKSVDAVKDRIRPDFFVRNEDGMLVVTLNDSNLPLVRISADGQSLLDNLQAEATRPVHASGEVATAAEQDKRDGLRFMRDSIQRAESFIDSLAQRRQTLLAVMEVIVKMQRAYFLTGQVETLRPMTLEDVESRCDYDKSTISRVTSSKYADTEWGIIQLKSLFTNAVGDSTQTAILEVLRQVIDDEDKRQPLTDDALVAELENRGLNIARRTVAKYRQLLGYGSAHQRREA